MDKVTGSIIVLGILCVINLNSLIILTWQWEESKSTINQLLLANERYTVQIRTLEAMAGLWSTDDEAPQLHSKQIREVINSLLKLEVYSIIY